MRSGYYPDGLRRDMVTLVGQRGWRQHTLLRRADIVQLPFVLVMGAAGGVGIASNHPRIWITAASAAVAGIVAAAACHVPIARTLAVRTGRSAWWCANHVVLPPARFVVWADAEIASRTGTHLIPDDPTRDRAVARELELGAAAVRLDRSAKKLQVSAVLTSAVPLVASLVHGSVPWASHGSTPDAIRRQAVSAATDPQRLRAAFTCADLVERTVPAARAEGGVAFLCTSAHHRTVTYAYFATPTEARAWAESERRTEHVTTADVFERGSTAVVTSDPAVLENLRALDRN